ncbi:MAG: methylenetetrahydrofolate reductase [NAD(P)H] [Lentisphaeria bacterium]|nr:methylenetetrahydrofolate reductase [NAD(P)H] [Lentisphaeria bacterium]
MFIRDILGGEQPSISFEFFPPKKESGLEELYSHAAELSKLPSNFFTVTYGAGGTTRGLTEKVVDHFQTELSKPSIPHLTCVGNSRDELKEIISGFKTKGIDNILALRGDPPKGSFDFEPHPDGFVNASGLVSLIKEVDDFSVGVAGYPEGHPETPNKLADMEHLKTKVDAGADFIITQLFFDNHDFLDFRDRCRLVGINVPILAGIMPALSFKGVQRMCGLCGAKIPAKLLEKLMNANEEDIPKIGIEWAIQQSNNLIANGVEGLHLYTLNKSRATTDILEGLIL